ncbi:winged helix-turn-helix domain-containing protein [Nocardioides campestrisoli]|uniref:winged helix-turn-helix domain-containing protein n=1 Tax=Nocardioides campestrisoli TaxID=2736757 RepID=UPI00163DD3A4|nr:winged helix-turn-helix domain-containing protein [Nocardioides campestrisoli]
MERTTVTLDEQSLAALSHPLRARLLSLLRIEGPSTASGLAERLGESSGLTSYHLRKLADAGLIEEDPERGSRRERWWRAAHGLTAYSASDFLGSRPAYRATQEMRRQAYRWQLRLLEQWLAEEAEWDEEWVEAADSSDDVLTLTPDRAKAMTAEIRAVVERYRDETAPADESAARVLWLQHLVPFRGELPL